jgi:hypothetical protein
VWITYLLTTAVVVALLLQQPEPFEATFSSTNLLILEVIFLCTTMTCLFGRRRTGMTSTRLANGISAASFPEDSVPPAGLLGEIGHHYNISRFRSSLALSIIMLTLGQALIGVTLLERLTMHPIGPTLQEAFLGISIAFMGLISCALSTILYKWVTRNLKTQSGEVHPTSYGRP